MGRGPAAAEAEASWLAAELLPQLQQSASPDEVAGGWQVAAGRVTAVEDRLTGLETSAPDESRGARAGALRDAVRDARLGVADLLVSRDPALLARDLVAIRAGLEAALAPRPRRPGARRRASPQRFRPAEPQVRPRTRSTAAQPAMAASVTRPDSEAVWARATGATMTTRPAPSMKVLTLACAKATGHTLPDRSLSQA